MKKFGSLLLFLCVVHLLALVGLVGYLFGTGRLDKSKAVVIADLLKHQGTPDKLREQVSEMLEPATSSAPASQQGVAATNMGTLPVAMTAEELMLMKQQAKDQEWIRLQTAAQDLRNRQEMLEKLKAEVE